jgi:hypothetical protein
VKHLLECFKQPLLRLDDAGDTFSIWLSRAIFQEYLEGLDGLTEVPDTILLQKYDEVALSLVSRGLAIQHFNNELSDLDITIRNAQGETVHRLHTATPALASVTEVHHHHTRNASPNSTHSTSTLNPTTTNTPMIVVVGGITKTMPTDSVQIRFPYSSIMLDLFASYFNRNVPGELWYGCTAKRWLSDGQDLALREDLGAALATLQTELLRGLGLGDEHSDPSTTVPTVPTAPTAPTPPAAPAAPTGGGNGKVGDVEEVREPSSSNGAVGISSSVGSDPQRWLWKLEDWALGMRLLGESRPAEGGGAAASSVLDSLTLTCAGGGTISPDELATVLCNSAGLVADQPLSAAATAFVGISAGGDHEDAAHTVTAPAAVRLIIDLC